MLKQEYKEGETNLQQALDLSIKVLSKTLDTNKLTSDKGIEYPTFRFKLNQIFILFLEMVSFNANKVIH